MIREPHDNRRPRALGDAKFLLDKSMARVDEETRESMLTNLRLIREIMAAWAAHGRPGAGD